MENAFGYDFSRVRIHRNDEAKVLSHQLGALAFTHGSDVYFGNNMYDPAGSSGKRLLAHELTHVVQQGHSAPLGNSMAASLSVLVRALHQPSTVSRILNRIT